MGDEEEIEGVRNDQSKALVRSFSTKTKTGKSYPVFNTINDGNDPYMTILLPASTFYGSNSAEHGPMPWVELGCQVRSARLVDGVKFRGDNKEDENVEAKTENEEDVIFTL